MRAHACAALVAIVSLTACGDRAKGRENAGTPEERLAAALQVCGEDAGTFAQRVCGNETLAALDGEMREALVAEAASVSEAGAQMLVQNQQRWLEAQRIACGIIDVDAEPSAVQLQCLESEFRARANDAQSAVQEAGGFTFQTMELVDATPVTAEIASNSGLGDDAPAAVVRDIRFPRIDGPQTPEIQRFNELVAQQPQFRLEDATNEVVDYHIAYASPEIISVRFDLSSDTLGAAHPNNTSKAVNVLMRTGQPLTEGDVFQSGSGWEAFITRRAVQEITRTYAESGFSPPERDVRESATKPHLWLITEGGLVLLFPPYSFGGPHVLGGTEVTIPWAELRPYLNPAAPAPIRPTA
ncbi:MAG: DUF3298 domain-containing protein [Hyphomonadaceae bacterium]